MRTKSGPYRWFQSRGEAFRDEDGKPYRMAGSIRDITKRVEAEEALRESELRLKTVISDAPVVITSVNQEGEIDLFDGRALSMLGFQPGQFVGANYFELWQDRAYMTRSMRECLSGKTPAPTTLDISNRLLETRYSPVRAADGQVTGAITVCIDVTERVRAEEEARKHRDELAHVARVSTMGEMATGIAHELNQPLAAIASYSFAARMNVEGGASPDDLRELLGKLEDQTIRAGDIVRRLRDFVKKNESVRARVDLNTLVRDVARFVEPDIKQAGAVLVLPTDAPPLDVVVDQIQIQQVLVNLIRNAVDAMRETPSDRRKVIVSSRILSDDYAEVAVSDAGKGLAEDELEQVFQAYFSTKQEGMGMGLPISRSLVEAHGGRLWAKSNAGPGVTFGFTIPLESGHGQ